MTSFLRGASELPPVTVGELYESKSGKLFKIILNASFGGSPMVVIKEPSMEDGIIVGRIQFEELFKKHDPFKYNKKSGPGPGPGTGSAPEDLGGMNL